MRKSGGGRGGHGGIEIAITVVPEMSSNHGGGFAQGIIGDPIDIDAILIVSGASDGGPGCHIHDVVSDPGIHTPDSHADGGHAHDGRGGTGHGRGVAPTLGSSGVPRFGCEDSGLA